MKSRDAFLVADEVTYIGTVVCVHAGSLNGAEISLCYESALGLIPVIIINDHNAEWPHVDRLNLYFIHLFEHFAWIVTSVEGGYVFGSVCVSVCLSVCLSVCPFRRITEIVVNGF